MSDSGSDENNLQITETSEEAKLNSLADKSKKLYKKTYSKLKEWRTKKRISSFSENVLLEYFQEMSTKLAPSSLWTEYSIMKSTLNIYENTDISKYEELQAFLKSKSDGYEPKKAKTFSTAEVNTFINKAPDEVYLLIKAAVIFGVMGACRRQELQRMLFENVKDLGKRTLLINIMKTKIKTDRIFTVTGQYYDIIKKYTNLRPSGCKNERFFIKYYNGKCSTQNVGINSFGNMGKTVASYMNLPNPELYTGQCFRRTSATFFDSGGDITEGSSEEKAPSKNPPETDSDSDISDSKSTTAGPSDPLGEDGRAQCRFCGEFTKHFVDAASDACYVTNNKTTLSVNGMNIEIDFDDQSPKTVCRACDGKLKKMIDFVKLVKYAQDNLLNLGKENRELVVVKTEYESHDDNDDSNGDDTNEEIDTANDNKLMEAFTGKRKSKENYTAVPKKIKVKEPEIERSLLIEIKQEITVEENTDEPDCSVIVKCERDVDPMEMDNGNDDNEANEANLEFSVAKTGTVHETSELETATRNLMNELGDDGTTGSDRENYG